MNANEIRYMAIDRDGFFVIVKELKDAPADTAKVRRVYRTNQGTWQPNTSEGYVEFSAKEAAHAEGS